MSGGQCVALHLPVISAVGEQSSFGDGDVDPTSGYSNTSTPTTAAAAAAPTDDNGATDSTGGRNSSSTTTTSNDPTKSPSIPSETEPTSELTTSTSDDLSVQAAYDREFNLPQETRDRIYAREVNRIRKQSEGKASLERYRLASARIFQVIVEALVTHIGKGNFVFERASIDELFLDVTSHCYNTSEPGWQPKTSSPTIDTNNNNTHKNQTAPNNNETKSEQNAATSDDIPDTVLCASSKIDLTEQDDEFHALRKGCLVAHGVRKAVLDALGFTLSAGISTSKMVAKLGATYGKPAGQAVILPSAIPHILDETKIKKVRNLGGKFGREVQKLLPNNEDTMGSVRLLSLPVLCKALGMQSGKMVFDLCRGISDEPVKETRGALTKSVTAFKSFGEADSLSLQKWISVLVTDVIHRIQVDTERNNRYPTTCVIQYYWKNEGSSETKGASMRIPFPSKPVDLLKKVQETLKTKTKIKICRLGICAVGFEHRPNNGGIVSFFQKGGDKKALTTAKTKMLDDVSNSRTLAKKCGMERFFNDGYTSQTKGQSATHLQQPDLTRTPKIPKQSNKYITAVKSKAIIKSDMYKSTDSRMKVPPSTAEEESFMVKTGVDGHNPTQRPSNVNGLDPDLVLAQKLQASFERENYVFKQSARSKKAKIDHFFKAKNK